MELLAWPGANHEQTEVLEEFVAMSEVYSLEESIILRAIEIRKTYKTKLPDAIIATTALVNNLTLITRNTKDFERIDTISVLNPYEV